MNIKAKAKIAAPAPSAAVAKDTASPELVRLVRADTGNPHEPVTADVPESEVENYTTHGWQRSDA